MVLGCEQYFAEKFLTRSLQPGTTLFIIYFRLPCSKDPREQQTKMET
jgi:hypothetical protein